LKDAYSLYEIRSASDDKVTALTNVPGNIGSDYAVYVNNSENPTKVLGYRDGNQ